jgi:hypothetical protein
MLPSRLLRVEILAMGTAGRDNEKQDGKRREKPSHGLFQGLA